MLKAIPLPSLPSTCPRRSLAGAVNQNVPVLLIVCPRLSGTLACTCGRQRRTRWRHSRCHHSTPHRPRRTSGWALRKGHTLCMGSGARLRWSHLQVGDSAMQQSACWPAEVTALSMTPAHLCSRHTCPRCRWPGCQGPRHRSNRRRQLRQCRTLPGGGRKGGLAQNSL